MATSRDWDIADWSYIAPVAFTTGQMGRMSKVFYRKSADPLGARRVRVFQNHPNHKKYHILCICIIGIIRLPDYVFMIKFWACYDRIMATQHNQNKKIHRFFGSRVVRKKGTSRKLYLPPSPNFNVDDSGKRGGLFKQSEASTLKLGEGGRKIFEMVFFFRTTRTPFYDDFTIRCDAFMVIIWLSDVRYRTVPQGK